MVAKKYAVTFLDPRFGSVEVDGVVTMARPTSQDDSYRFYADANGVEVRAIVSASAVLMIEAMDA